MSEAHDMSDWTSAEHHARRAHRFYESGQWRQALAELKLAIGKDPNQSDWYVGLGLTLEALNRYDEAADAFRTVVQLRGDDPQTLLHLGTDLIRSQQPQAAIDVFHRLEQLDRDFEPAYCHRILAYAMLGQFSEAETQFYLARQLSDACPTCLDHLGHTWAMRGVFEKAIWCWNEAIRLDPTYPGVHASLGRAYWRMRQADRARRAFRRHLELEPEDTEAMIDLARLLIALGRLAQADQVLVDAADVDPHDTTVHALRGEVALLENEPAQAELHLKHAQSLDPARAGTRLHRAMVAHRSGQVARARRLLIDEAACEGHTTRQTLDLARMLNEVGEFGRTLGLLTTALDDTDDLRPLIRSRKDRATAYQLRGDALQHGGRLTEAIRDWRRGARAEPRRVALWARLAEAYLDTRRVSRAAACIRRAQLLSPEDEALTRLARRVNLKRSRRRVARALTLA